MAFMCSSLCSNSQVSKEDGAWSAIGDPTCSAAATFGWKALGSTQELNKKHERLHEFFFDAERKRMTTINNLDGEKWAFTKGALDPIEGIITKIYENDELVNINDSHLEKIREANHSMASGALRVLALTCKRIEDDEDYNDIADVEKDMISCISNDYYNCKNNIISERILTRLKNKITWI